MLRGRRIHSRAITHPGGEARIRPRPRATRKARRIITQNQGLQMTVPTLAITRPDDWHLHLRDGDAMRAVVGATARVFGRAVIMPNL